MPFLSLADFAGRKLNPDMTRFEILLLVAEVALEKYEYESKRITEEDGASAENEEEKNLIYDEENTTEPDGAKKPKKEQVLEHMKKEPKLMSSAIKALSNANNIPNNNHVNVTVESVQHDGTTIGNDLMTVMEDVKEKKKYRKNSATAERKLKQMSIEEGIDAMKKKKKKQKRKGPNPNPPPRLPEESSQREIKKK